MKTINLNGVWYDIHSPSHYVCRDVPGVSICYNEREYRKTKLVRRKIKGKFRKVKKTVITIIREWVVRDHDASKKFVSLSEACYRIGLAYAELQAENREEDQLTP